MHATKSHMRPGSSVHGAHELERGLAGDAAGEAPLNLPRNLSFDACAASDSHVTSLSDMLDGLPTAVKTSLGPLRSIQRSAGFRSWASYFYGISATSMGAHVSRGPLAEQRHHHALVSTTTTTTELGLPEQHPPPSMNSNQKRRRTSSAMSLRSALDPAPLPSSELVEYVEPQRKGIDRFCGANGQLLVNNALAEQRSAHGQSARIADGSSSSPAAGADLSNERRAYVQGLTWLLQGLPNDLDDHERTDLRSAMPPILLGPEGDHTHPTHHHHHHHHHRGASGSGAGIPRRLGSSGSSARGGGGGGGGGHPVYHESGGGGGGARRSFIQRLVAMLIVLLLLPAQLLWAYLVAGLAHAVHLERKYRVAEQVVKHSGEWGYRVGRHGVRLSGALYYNRGARRVGAALTDAVAYVADGVVKGVGDGLREACWGPKEREGEP